MSEPLREELIAEVIRLRDARNAAKKAYHEAQEQFEEKWFQLTAAENTLLYERTKDDADE